MLNVKTNGLLGSLFYLLLVTNTVYAEKETYFACDKGFKFETKKNAVRCIKQQRLTYRPPEGCEKSKKTVLNTSKPPEGLLIDKIGQKDMCVLSSNKKPFPPKCQNGYKLQVRKGKDVCGKGKPEVILPATKKVFR